MQTPTKKPRSKGGKIDRMAQRDHDAAVEAGVKPTEGQKKAITEDRAKAAVDKAAKKLVPLFGKMGTLGDKLNVIAAQIGVATFALLYTEGMLSACKGIVGYAGFKELAVRLGFGSASAGRHAVRHGMAIAVCKAHDIGEGPKTAEAARALAANVPNLTGAADTETAKAEAPMCQVPNHMNQTEYVERLKRFAQHVEKLPHSSEDKIIEIMAGAGELGAEAKLKAEEKAQREKDRANGETSPRATPAEKCADLQGKWSKAVRQMTDGDDPADMLHAIDGMAKAVAAARKLYKKALPSVAK